MQSILRPSPRQSPEQGNRIRFFRLVLSLLVLSFTLESIIEIILLPANTTRWLIVIAIVDITGIIAFLISRSGNTRSAGIFLVIVLWGLMTGLSITENGVRSPTIDIAYLVIILVAGMVIDEQAGLGTGILSAVTLFGMSLAGMKGLLPASPVQRTNLAIWEADIFYLAIVIVLQYLTIHSIRQAMEQAHREQLERIRLEASLREAEEERARNQTRIELHRLLTDQLEKERLKIARDLHDGPVQDLIGTIFSLKGLIDEAPDDHYQNCLAEVQASLQEQVSNLRAFSGELRSPTLVKFGLQKALLEHLNQFHEKHPGIAFRLSVIPENIELSEAIRLTLFRIYQEAMNNIARHAQASRVEVHVAEVDHEVTLEIHDNGVGFAPPQEWIDLARQGHLGMVGMRERVETIGGQFKVESQVNQGTTIQVLLPHKK